MLGVEAVDTVAEFACVEAVDTVAVFACVEAVDTVAVFACGAGNQDVGRLAVLVENSFGNGGGAPSVRSWSSMWSSSSALNRHYLSDLPDWR